MPEEKRNIEWVKERAACSVAEMFTQLMLEVEADVKSRNDLRPERSYYGFKFVKFRTCFAVEREGSRPYRSITFSLTDKAIIVTNEDNTELCAVTLTLNDEGECKFRVNGAERESWQLRRMVLESLFFEGP